MDSLTVKTPLGYMIAKADASGICSLDFTDEHISTKNENALLLQLQKELEEYFDGKRREFDLPLTPKGTPFQLSVWEVLRKIPYGETVPYAQEAAMLGRPTAVRAAANANGKNPISILIPCHRVIASGGGIGGYSGGTSKKEFLLKLERQNRS